MAKIQLLPPQVANQIAAGEVIERPASVLKELVENSIDAKATYIKVSIEQGGVLEICVEDNGCGMSEQDLSLAACQHATSKLTQLNDLACIQSLGFRGEALASIAAVAEFTITSKKGDADTAFAVTYENQKPKIKKAALNEGTRITVRHLFEKAPVRRKFLKTQRTETIAITACFKALALSHPKVFFELYLEGRLTYKLKPADNEQDHLIRVSKLLGKNFKNHAKKINHCAARMQLTGWVADANYTRSQTDGQFFFLNGRMLKDKIIMHAIKSALSPHLPPGRYPCFVLYFSFPASAVDVNVHPTKHEVRFEDPAFVHQFIQQALEQAFVRAALVQNGKIDWSTFKPVEPKPFTYTPRAAYSPALMPKKSISKKKDDEKIILRPKGVADPPVTTVQNNLTYKGFIPDKYVLFYHEIKNKFYCLDLKKAQLDLLQDVLVNNTNSKSQQLAIPIRVKLRESVKETVIKHEKKLNQLGFDFLIIDDVLIKALPKCFLPDHSCQANAWETFFKLLHQSVQIDFHAMMDKILPKWLNDLPPLFLSLSPENLFKNYTQLDVNLQGKPVCELNAKVLHRFFTD